MVSKEIVTLAAIFAVCIIVYYFFGLDIAIYFAIVGVPVVFIGIVLYYKIKIDKGQRTVNELIRTKESEIYSTINNIVKLANNLEDIKLKYNVDTDPAEFEITKLLKNLESKGIKIKKIGDTFDYEIIKSRLENVSLSEIREIERNWKDIQAEIIKILIEGVLKKIDWYLEKLKELESVGYVVYNSIRELDILKSQVVISDNLDKLKSIAHKTEEEFYSALENAINFAEKIVKEVNSELIEKVRLASENLETRDYDNVVYFLKEVANEVNINLRDNFTIFRRKLLESLDRILKLVKDEYSDIFKDLKRTVESINTPTRFLELREIESKIISEMRYVLAKLNSEIQSELQSTKDANLPEHFVEIVVPKIEEIPDDLEKAVEIFTRNYNELSNVKSKIDIIKKIAKSYPKVERAINKVLKEKGKATFDDIKVRNVEIFFETYARNHPEVDYIDGQLILKDFKPQIVQIQEKPEIKVSEKKDVESVCEGIKERVEKYLPKYDEILKNLMVEKGFVSNTDKIPIKNKDFIPCLLWLWSKKENLTFAKYGSYCVVYDKGQMQDLIAKRINERVDLSIAEYTYDELKELLEIDLPMEEFKKLLKDISETDYQIELSENSVKFSKGDR